MTGETPEVSIAMSRKVGTPEPILYLQVETRQEIAISKCKTGSGVPIGFAHAS